MKYEITSELLGAVDALFTARDFCGDEAAALREWEWENRKLTEGERFAVRQELARQWADFREEARR
jgi:hypothetical protein